MPAPLHTLLVAGGAASYDGEARRLVRMGRVRVDGAVACDEDALVERVRVTVADPDREGMTLSFLDDLCTVVIAKDHVPAPIIKTLVAGIGGGGGAGSCFGTLIAAEGGIGGDCHGPSSDRPEGSV